MCFEFIKWKKLKEVFESWTSMFYQALQLQGRDMRCFSMGLGKNIATMMQFWTLNWGKPQSTWQYLRTCLVTPNSTELFTCYLLSESQNQQIPPSKQNASAQLLSQFLKTTGISCASLGSLRGWTEEIECITVLHFQKCIHFDFLLG